MTEPRNDENLEGIQGLARGLDRLLPRGGTRGEAIRKLDANQDYWQARAEAAERELADKTDEADQLRRVGATAVAKLTAIRELWEEWEVSDPDGANDAYGDLRKAILDGEGEE